MELARLSRRIERLKQIVKWKGKESTTLSLLINSSEVILSPRLRQRFNNYQVPEVTSLHDVGREVNVDGRPIGKR